MKKFLVETYYTCTFKTIHRLDELNDKEFSKIDTKILLEVRGKKHPANICKLPFYKKSYVKGVN